MTLTNRKVNVNYLDILKTDETYNTCSSMADQLQMLNYCNEFSDYFFVEDMGGRSVVISPVLTRRAITNNDGSETFVNDFNYSFFPQNEFIKSKVKYHFYIDKQYNKSTFKSKVWFANYWLETRTDICTSYKRTVFDPNPKFDNPEIFNFWTGFVEPVRGDVTPFLNHIDNLIEGTAEQKAHIIKLIGFTVKFPHIRTDTTIILQGKQGSGKTTISETLRAMCPSHTAVVDNLEQLLTSFNHEYHHTKYFLHEESIFSGDKKTNEQIKPLITGATRKSRIKNVTSLEIQNYSFHIFTSNNDNPVRIEDSDRRHNAFTCSNKLIGYKAYFKAYYDWLNNGGANALVNFFQNEVDYTHFEPTISIETDAKNSIKAQNLNPIESFVFNILSGAIDPIPENNLFKTENMETQELAVPRNKLFEHFQAFHNSAGRNIMSISHQNFNSKIQQIFKFPDSYTEWKNKTIGRFFKFPVLAEAQKLFAQHVKVSDFFSLTCPNGAVSEQVDSTQSDLLTLVTQPSKPLPEKDRQELARLNIKPISFTMPVKSEEPAVQPTGYRMATNIPTVKKAHNENDPFADEFYSDITADLAPNFAQRGQHSLIEDNPFADDFSKDFMSWQTTSRDSVKGLTDSVADEDYVAPPAAKEKLKFGRRATTH